MRGRWVAIVLAVLLTGCATDAHIPPFARAPYEPFSRQAVVAIALREWRAFGSAVAPSEATDKPERAEGLWQRVGEYWWLGLGSSEPEARWTGKHDAAGHVFPPERDATYAWSAAFVSYVMRMAGAGAGFGDSDSDGGGGGEKKKKDKKKDKDKKKGDKGEKSEKKAAPAAAPAAAAPKEAKK